MIKKIKIFLLLITFLSAFPSWANLPYHPIEFPRDDAAHYDNVPYPIKNMMEWWYYNGTLTSKTGRKFGYYLSYNYIQRDLMGVKVTLPLFQIQITDIDNKKVYGRQVFITDNKYSISTQKLDLVFNNDLTLRKENNTYLLDGLVQAESGQKLKFSMQLTPTRNVLLVGKTGLIDMGDNTNSYYYTYTRLNTMGYIQIGNETFELDSEHSLSWMDHQWGDFIILPWRNQWMWASVQLENGLDILLGTVLDPKTKKVIRGSANMVMPDDSRAYTDDVKEDFIYKAHILYGMKHPLTYDLTIKSINLQLRLDALVSGQDMNGIWEGVSLAEGVFEGRNVRGQAYTENTVKY